MNEIDRAFQEMLRREERIHIVPRNGGYWNGYQVYYHHFRVSRPADVSRATMLAADSIRIASKARPHERIHVSMPYFSEAYGSPQLSIKYVRTDFNARICSRI